MSLQRYVGAAWASVHGPTDPVRMLRWLCEQRFHGLVPSPSPRPIAYAALAASASDYPIEFPAVRCSSILAERPSTAGLASARDGDLRLGRQAAQQGVALAAAVATRFVILEPGLVPVMGEVERDDLGDPSYDWTKERAEALMARRKVSLPSSLDRVCRAVFELARSNPDFTFCLTQSRSLLAVASVEALRLVFEDLGSVRLCYWHDAAIAARREQVLGEPQGAWLDAFADRCVGCNLGDARQEGLYLPPGSGGVDYPLLASYLRPAGRTAAACLELDPSVPSGEMPGMRACLDKFGL
ncbi:MAG: hypothetical protein ABL997_15015 [Planctomycetota bacterium]